MTALTVFPKLVTRNNFRALGFDHLEDVQSAKLGEPLRDFFVPLDELKRYAPGVDPRGLIKSGQALLFPVLVGDAVRSSISVSLVKDTWKATSYGAPKLTRYITDARAAKAAETQLAPSAFFVVRVPALMVSFVGHSDAGVLLLTPIVDDARFGFKAGATLPAGQVFEKLQPAAQKHDGSPT